MSRKIDPSEYMIDGWDRQGEVHYVRGSRYNKMMMKGLWIYYVLIVGMVIRLVWVLNS